MLALPLALLLAGAPAEAADPLRIEPVEIRNLDVGLGSARFDLVVEAERLRGLPLRLRSLRYAVVVDRVTVSQAERDYTSERVRLRKGEPVTFAIPVELDAAEALTIATKGLMAGKALRVQVKGAAGVQVLVFPIRVPFQTDLVDLSR